LTALYSFLYLAYFCSIETKTGKKKAENVWYFTKKYIKIFSISKSGEYFEKEVCPSAAMLLTSCIDVT